MSPPTRHRPPVWAAGGGDIGTGERSDVEVDNTRNRPAARDVAADPYSAHRLDVADSLAVDR